jgi:5,10-methenyltetrahydrofolate synthetase
MTKDENSKKLIAILRDADVVIGYEPLSDEADYRSYFKTHGIQEPSEIIPPDPTASPGELANRFVLQYEEKKVAVLIPGRLFDLSGTRYGRGGGWYDRFLSYVPEQWTRIGVLRESEFNDEPLKRELWDQPVDYLLIDRNGVWEGAAVEGGSRGTV